MVKKLKTEIYKNIKIKFEFIPKFKILKSKVIARFDNQKVIKDFKNFKSFELKSTNKTNAFNKAKRIIDRF